LELLLGFPTKVKVLPFPKTQAIFPLGRPFWPIRALSSNLLFGMGYSSTELTAFPWNLGI